MLIIDASINREKRIGSIFIHRIKTGKDGINTYRIVEPEGFEKRLIKHEYDDSIYGYMPLLNKALNIILG